MENKTGVVIAAVAIVMLSIPAGFVIAQTLTHSASDGTVYKTNSGLEVALTSDEEVAAQPFDDDQTVTINNVSFSAAGSARIEPTAYTGNQTSASGIGAASNDITINPIDKNRVSIGGGVDTISYSEVKLDDGTVDIDISGDGSMRLVIEGLPDDQGTQVVDASTGERVGIDPDTTNGIASFDLAAGDYSLLVQGGPSSLVLRDETNLDQLITSTGELEIRFFAEDSGTVETRTVTNGTADMTGLPVDERLIASANIDGYYQRSIVIDSILEQQTLYLLNTSEDVSQIDWVLNDETGKFPASETTLKIERPLNIDNQTEWRTIAGDRFGATERMAAQLATGDRYRLRVTNDEGDVRLLGSYVAAGAAQEPLRIGTVTFPGAEDSGAAFSAMLNTDEAVLEYRYRDNQERTESLGVEVIRLSDSKTVYQTTLSGPISSIRDQIPLSSINHTDDAAYRVEYTADRGTAGIFEGNRQLGDLPEIAKDWNLDPRILELFGFVTIVGIFGATVILSPRHAGLVASVVAMALMLIGVVQINRILISFAFVVSGLFAAGGRQ